MLKRCYNPATPGFRRYGGRGIFVCDDWRYSFTSFEQWAKDNGFEPKLQLNRINNNGSYSPSNCQWVTAFENNQNRSDTIRLPNGETIAEAAIRTKLLESTLRKRFRKGDSIEEIFRPLYSRKP